MLGHLLTTRMTWAAGAVGPPFTPLVFSNITPAPLSTGAVVAWDVAPGAQGQVEYGLTTGYGSLSVLEPTYLTHGHERRRARCALRGRHVHHVRTPSD